MPLGLYDVGRTTVYAARRDPRFSYCLYVPPGYREGPRRPEIVVVVHGSPRGFMEFRDRFSDFGSAHNTLIVSPLFPVGVGGDGNPDGYKYLSEPGIRYDRVLLDILGEVEERWDVAADRFGLFGFSGGAQFANRFLFLHPRRLWATSIVSPGSVTLWSDKADWWVGIRDLQRRLDLPPDVGALRRVAVQTLVGGADLEIHEITHRAGGRYWMPGANDAGATRPERLEALRRSLEQAGVRVCHEVVGEVAHDPWPLVERSKRFLAAELARRRAANPRLEPADA